MSADTSLLSRTVSSLKSLVKMMAQSRKCPIASAPHDSPLVILGNGPSLRATIDNGSASLRAADLMAVNFAANTDEYLTLRPRYYVMADPHFFDGAASDPNVYRLWDRISALTDWDMTIFIPASRRGFALPSPNPRVTFATFNPVGVEGFAALEHKAYDMRRGMPRPRNVLIPAIMIGIWLGYKEIYLAGADHSWTQTLSVSDDNTVISVQPHFYADNDKERHRVSQVYKDIRLHQILMSFHIAFRAYHRIASYASSRGVTIYNATPGSFIDAFPRRPLPAHSI